MSLRLAIVGKTGQLSKALQTHLKNTGHQALFLGRETLDLSAAPQAVEASILDLPENIDAVILAAAYTAVDKAETEIELSFAVNGAAPGAIARACKSRNIAFIHISTDYVFQGDATAPYTPDDITDPINTYGASKLAGEQAVLDAQCNGAILRTSWVFDGQGKNFLTTMLRLAQTRSKLNVVDDQWGRPTYAGHLAQAVIKAAETICRDKNFKIACYHVTGSGPVTSWASFARAIFKQATGQIPHEMTVCPIPTKDYPTPAKRPAYSVLDTSLYENTFDHKLPSWEVGLTDALAENDNKDNS